MTAQIRMRDSGGTLRTIARIRMRDAAGALRTIVRVRMRDAGGTLRTVFQYLTASASPTTATATASTATITTGSSTVTVVGGTSPFTYQWDNIYGDAITATTPTAATTTFRKTGTIQFDVYMASFVCTVTDALGETAATNQVDVTITRT